MVAKEFKNQKPTENTLGLDIQIYPNPVTENIYVHSNGDLIQDIKIIGSRGEIISNFNVHATQWQLNVKSLKLNSGLYFIKVITKNGEKLQKLMIN